MARVSESWLSPCPRTRPFDSDRPVKGMNMLQRMVSTVKIGRRKNFLQNFDPPPPWSRLSHHWSSPSSSSANHILFESQWQASRGFLAISIYIIYRSLIRVCLCFKILWDPLGVLQGHHLGRGDRWVPGCSPRSFQLTNRSLSRSIKKIQKGLKRKGLKPWAMTISFL